MKITTKKLLMGMLLCSTVGFAQTRFGVKAGLNIASLPGDYPSYMDNLTKPGFHAGFTTDIKLAGKLSLLGEVLVSTQGGKTDYRPSPTESVKQNIKLTNLNIPVLFKYKVIEKLSIEAGPQVGFVLNARNELKYTNALYPSQNETIEIDGLNDGTFTSVVDGNTYMYKKSIRTVDFSVNLGATYAVHKNVYLQARYNRGLTAVDLGSTVGTSTSSLNLKNSVFQFSLGYLFN